MFLKTTTFDHSTSNFSKSVGISREAEIRAREILFFVTFSNLQLQKELYDEDDPDMPESFQRISGDLERCIKLINNEEEYAELLLNFRSLHKYCLKTVAYKRILDTQDQSDLDQDEKLKLNLLKALQSIIEKETENLVPNISHINKDTLFKRINLVAQSKHSFANYWKLLEENFDFSELSEEVA